MGLGTDENNPEDRDRGAVVTVAAASGIAVDRVSSGDHVARRLQIEATLVQSFLASLKAEFGDDDVLVADMIEGSTRINELLSTAGLRVLELESMQDGIKATIAKLRQRDARFARQINALRDAMRNAMSASDARRLELPSMTLSMAASPRRLKITDETLIPEAFWVTKRELSKQDIAAFLKEGKSIPGAALDNGGDVLRILPS
jgi:hypothetical protein